jgi:hypothetical protein
VTAPVQPFIHRGFPPTQAPAIITRPHPRHRGQVIFPGAVPGVTVVQQSPQAFFVGPGSTPVALPPIGTPRDQVITQLGNPNVTVLTRDGETLYFAGGVTVFIQNGQVANPR